MQITEAELIKCFPGIEFESNVSLSESIVSLNEKIKVIWFRKKRMEECFNLDIKEINEQLAYLNEQIIALKSKINN